LNVPYTSPTSGATFGPSRTARWTDVGVDPESFLPETFDVFYRVGGSGTWFRDPLQNNIPLAFSDLDPANPDPDPDPENQVADSGPI